MDDSELELAQLLCTGLCHDLAGPVGAVAAGVELIGGDPTQVDTETLGLIGNSSAAASSKLKFIRAALGAAGAASGDPRALLEGYLDAVAGPNGRPALTWPSSDALTVGAGALGGAWIQTILNLCLLSLEMQPSCRALALQVTNGAGLSVLVQATGAPERASSIRDDIAAAVAGRVPPALSAKTIHANLAGRMVRTAGGTIDLAASGNSVTVTAHFRKTASAAT